VPGIVTTLIPGNYVEMSRKQVNDLPFALVAPLGAQHYRSLCSHVVPFPETWFLSLCVLRDPSAPAAFPGEAYQARWLRDEGVAALARPSLDDKPWVLLPAGTGIRPARILQVP
jgi:hypothetical protein